LLLTWASEKGLVPTEKPLKKSPSTPACDGVALDDAFAAGLDALVGKGDADAALGLADFIVEAGQVEARLVHRPGAEGMGVAEDRGIRLPRF
jgi:hypothetical protein